MSHSGLNVVQRKDLMALTPDSSLIRNDTILGALKSQMKSLATAGTSDKSP